MALHYKKARAKTFCSLEYFVFVLLNDRSRMKEDFHVRFCEKFEVKFLLLTRLRGRGITQIPLLLDLIFRKFRFWEKYDRKMPKSKLRITGAADLWYTDRKA